MRAITLASQKGGTGKSTLCIGLAIAAIEDGERVSLLETDRQGTISNWAERRANPEPVVERVADRFQLERALRAFERRGCTLAIIDTAGSDNDFASDAIRAANLCLIPARPSSSGHRGNPTDDQGNPQVGQGICLRPQPNATARTASYERRLGLKRGWSARAPMKAGVDLTLKALQTAFSRAQVVEVDPAGQKFDPHRHQAMQMVPSAQPANTVVDVYQKGYLINDRILRPALVTVVEPAPVNGNG